MLLNLSQLALKIPSAKIKVNSLSFELHEILGWVILEADICVGDGDEAESITSVTIPVMLSEKEVLELFSIKKVEGNTRRSTRSTTRRSTGSKK